MRLGILKNRVSMALSKTNIANPNIMHYNQGILGTICSIVGSTESK